MKFANWLTTVAILLAMPGILVPQSGIMANEQKLPNARIQRAAPNSTLDAKLDKSGAFTGRTINHDGTPVVGTSVVIARGKTIIGSSVTDERGNFALQNLKPGVYQVSSGETVGNYRLWSENTAPPSAKPHGVLVLGENGARGQYGLSSTIAGENLGLILLVSMTGLATAALILAIEAENQSQKAKDIASRAFHSP